MALRYITPISPGRSARPSPSAFRVQLRGPTIRTLILPALRRPNCRESRSPPAPGAPTRSITTWPPTTSPRLSPAINRLSLKGRSLLTS